MIKEQSTKRVCIVIPAFNESKVIGDVISNIKNVFESTKYITEIIVVNDASSDNTAQIAEKKGAIVINHILNTGAVGATATGLSYAQQNNFDVACTMDGDGQHCSKDVLEGVMQLLSRKSDLLIGSRLINKQGMSKIKIIGNKGLSLITYMLFGINSTDSQSGLRIFSNRAIKSLRWKTSGYEFCSEMLWRAKQLKLNIDEYPIKAIYTDYSKSKGQNNWNAINIVKSLLKQRIAELLG